MNTELKVLQDPLHLTSVIFLGGFILLFYKGCLKNITIYDKNLSKVQLLLYGAIFFFQPPPSPRATAIGFLY